MTFTGGLAGSTGRPLSCWWLPHRGNHLVTGDWGMLSKAAASQFKEAVGDMAGGPEPQEAAKGMSQTRGS